MSIDPEGFNPEWIWGDEAQSTVFAQVYGCGHTAIFSFVVDYDEPRSSLANRLVNCYHDLDLGDENVTFPDRSAMREALWRAVRRVWSDCIQDPSITAVDAIVDIKATKCDLVSWKVHRHPLFSKFVTLLEESCKIKYPCQDCK